MALATTDAVVLELMTMGQQSAAHLGDLLRAASPSSSTLQQELAAEILSCCNSVIATLRANATTKKRKPVDGDSAAAACSNLSTPPRKRVRGGGDAIGVVTSGTTEDGFIWRKYGQKEINGRKHPRFYYRCAYRHQGCTATRRVQRTHQEGEPPAYEIAYYGEHTCRGAATRQQEDAAALLPPAVVDFGSNNAAWGACGIVPAAAPEQTWSSWDGETSQGGWSSSSSTSSDMGLEAQATHDIFQVEMPSADPVTEFLGGCFDWEWESFISHVPFDFDAQLPPSHCNDSGA